MSTLSCDGSYEGLLSAIFEAHRMRPMPREIVLGDIAQLRFDEDILRVETDQQRAARVQRAIERKLSPTSANHVALAYAARLPECGTLIYRYLRLGWALGADLDAHMTHPDVAAVQRLSRRVSWEVNKMMGLVRFRLTDRNVYYAFMQTNNDIVPLLAPHFHARMPDQDWMLHDGNHQTVALYNQREMRVFYNVGALAPLKDAEAELQTKALWRKFFETIAIESRVNPLCQRNHMPARYWKNLTEIHACTKFS